MLIIVCLRERTVMMVSSWRLPRATAQRGARQGNLDLGTLGLWLLLNSKDTMLRPIR